MHLTVAFTHDIPLDLLQETDEIVERVKRNEHGSRVCAALDFLIDIVH